MRWGKASSRSPVLRVPPTGPEHGGRSRESDTAPAVSGPPTARWRSGGCHPRPGLRSGQARRKRHASSMSQFFIPTGSKTGAPVAACLTAGDADEVGIGSGRGAGL
jgi:hypothetical protein